MRILLAEDEVLIAIELSHQLEENGHEVTVVTNGTQALERLEKDPVGFDGIVTDECMPGMRGSELVEALTERECASPVILHSSYAQPLQELADEPHPFPLLVAQKTLGSIAYIETFLKKTAQQQVA